MNEFEELYPFLGNGPTDPAPLLAEIRNSTLRKRQDIDALRQAVWERYAETLVAAADRLARAFRDGRKVLAFGNGGSATDAQDLVADLTAPAHPGWRPLPAIDLTQDFAMLTAVGNDVGFDSIFARQIIAYGEPGDVAVGFSTSGESRNIIAAFEQARRQGIVTVGFAGNDGGRMAQPGFLEAVLVVPSADNTRIQEAHATACHTLLCMVQALLRNKGEAE